MKRLFLVCLLLTELSGQNVPYPSIDTTLDDINMELSMNHEELLAIIQHPNFTNNDYFGNYDDEAHHPIPKPTEKVKVTNYSSMTIFAFYVEGIGVSLLALIGKYPLAPPTYHLPPLNLDNQTSSQIMFLHVTIT